MYGFTWKSDFCKFRPKPASVLTQNLQIALNLIGQFLVGIYSLLSTNRKWPTLPLHRPLHQSDTHTHKLRHTHPHPCYLPPPPCSLSGQRVAECRCVPSLPLMVFIPFSFSPAMWDTQICSAGLSSDWRWWWVVNKWNIFFSLFCMHVVCEKLCFSAFVCTSPIFVCVQLPFLQAFWLQLTHQVMWGGCFCCFIWAKIEWERWGRKDLNFNCIHLGNEKMSEVYYKVMFKSGNTCML